MEHQVITPAGPQPASSPVVVFAGETATFAGVGIELSIVAGDPKAIKTKGSNVTLAKPGRYTLDARSGFQSLRAVVICADPDCLRFIHVRDESLGKQTAEQARLNVLRSVALHGNGFDGTVESLRRHRLQDHGADSPSGMQNVVKQRPGGQSFSAG